MRSTILPMAVLLLLTVAFSPCEVSAQALPAATAPGAYISAGGSYAIFQSNYGQRVLGGAGAYVDINASRHVGLEAEGRWLRQHSVADIHQTTYLIGPRLQLRRGRYSPYVKVLAGVGLFNFAFNDASGRYFVIAPGGGVETALSNNWKIRVDVEYQRWPQFTYGTLTPFGVSFGLSYRLFNGSGR